ncbi:MAG TPA: hypothetical protein VE154_08025 [Chthoniobacterales bacterium]|nr:hypothetical protein [Chthoniobacterales bacterium]
MSQFKENIQITVDDRERPSGVVAELEKLSGVVVKVAHLNAGPGSRSLPALLPVESFSSRAAYLSLRDRNRMT